MPLRGRAARVIAHVVAAPARAVVATSGRDVLERAFTALERRHHVERAAPSEERGGSAPGQARIADAGFVAATLVFMALYLPPTAPFSAADAEPMAVAAAAQAKTSTQVAKIRPDTAGHGLAEDAHRNAPTKAKRDASAAPLQAPDKSAAGPAGNRPEAQATEKERRLRLMEKIQRLRAEIAPR